MKYWDFCYNLNYQATANCKMVDGKCLCHWKTFQHPWWQWCCKLCRHNLSHDVVETSWSVVMVEKDHQVAISNHPRCWLLGNTVGRFMAEDVYRCYRGTMESFWCCRPITEEQTSLHVTVLPAIHSCYVVVAQRHTTCPQFIAAIMISYILTAAMIMASFV